MITFLVIMILAACNINMEGFGMNIALHAQVGGDTIAGSVITTDGLQAAFRSRKEISTVKRFYPFQYETYFDIDWDLVIIEGWFPSMENFIYMTRNYNPYAIILFYCLDPSYPGLDIISRFHVDGFLTNSHQVRAALKKITRTEFLLLAADPDVFTLCENDERSWNFIYVGGGGAMLQHKPLLSDMLRAAEMSGSNQRKGLLLQGSNWEHVSYFNKISKGVLPKDDLGKAYCSAKAVLAATMKDQETHDMVNNRIFEALSSGAIVVSSHYEALTKLAGNLIVTIANKSRVTETIEAVSKVVRDDCAEASNDTAPDTITDTTVKQLARQLKLSAMQTFLHPVAASAEYSDSSNWNHSAPWPVREWRQAARQFVLRSHTWRHRVVPILDFYHDLFNSRSLVGDGRVAGPPHANQPKLLLIVSAAIALSSDLVMVIKPLILDRFSNVYAIIEVTENVWLRMVVQHVNISTSSSSTTDTPNDILGLNLSEYHVILSIVQPLDSVESSLRDLPPVKLTAHKSFVPVTQRRALYLFSHNECLWKRHFDNENVGKDRGSVNAETGAGVGGPGQGNGCALTQLSFLHADLVMFRSPIDLNLWRARGAQFNDLRLEHVFGSPTHLLPPSSYEKNYNNTSNNLMVIVCFWGQQMHCGRAQRDGVVRQHRLQHPSLRYDEHYQLLLLGGHWDDWVQCDVVGLQYEMLPFVSHVRQGRRGVAVKLVQSAQAVIIMHKSAVNNNNCNMSINNGDNGDDGDDVLWPVVLAGTDGKYLHFLQRNEHLLSIASACADWDHHYVDNKARSAMSRLISFVNHRARVSMQQLQDGHFSDQSLPLYRLVKKQACCLGYSDSPHHIPAIVHLKFNGGFVPGVDGSCCVSINNGPSLVCMIKPFHYLWLNISSQHLDQHHIFQSFNLTLTLTGVMTRDALYQVTLPIHKFINIQLWRPMHRCWPLGEGCLTSEYPDEWSNQVFHLTTEVDQQ